VLASETDWQVELFFKWIKQHLRIKQWRSAARRCLTEGAASSCVDAS
jgi:IS4 transposase